MPPRSVSASRTVVDHDVALSAAPLGDRPVPRGRARLSRSTMSNTIPTTSAVTKRSPGRRPASARRRPGDRSPGPAPPRRGCRPSQRDQPALLGLRVDRVGRWPATATAPTTATAATTAATSDGERDRHRLDDRSAQSAPVSRWRGAETTQNSAVERRGRRRRSRRAAAPSVEPVTSRSAPSKPLASSGRNSHGGPGQRTTRRGPSRSRGPTQPTRPSSDDRLVAERADAARLELVAERRPQRP